MHLLDLACLLETTYAASVFASPVYQDDQKEGLLGYDDTAFYYFFSSAGLSEEMEPLRTTQALHGTASSEVIVTVAVPWTCSMIYNALFPGQVAVEKDQRSWKMEDIAVASLEMLETKQIKHGLNMIKL